MLAWIMTPLLHYFDSIRFRRSSYWYMSRYSDPEQPLSYEVW